MPTKIINKNIYLLNSNDGIHSGITTFTKLISQVFEWNNVKVTALNYSDLPVDDNENSINIINLGLNSLSPIHWLRNREGDKSRNIIIIHDLPYLNNNLIGFNNDSNKFTRLISRLSSKYLKKWVYRSLFVNGDTLVCTNKRSYEFLRKIAADCDVFLDIRIIEHPLYYPKIVPRNNNINNNIINIGSFGYGNRLKDFSIIAEALHRLKVRCPHLADRLKFTIHSKPIDNNGLKNRELLINLVEKYSIQSNFSINFDLPESEIFGFFQSIDVLLLPYRNSSLYSASGPVNYARSHQVPVIGSGSIAKNENSIYFFNINNVESLSSVLEDVASNSDSWRKFVERNKVTSESKEWSNIIMLFNEIL